jgi:putative oxidoreductase
MKLAIPALLNLLFKPSNTQNQPSQIAWTILRVVAGVVMVHNGIDKLADIQGFATAYVEVIGLPFPIFFSYLAALTEVTGAPLLALGLFTRPAALGLTSTMLVAIYHHILVAGFNIPYIELSTLYAACFAFFVVNGGGAFSLDALITRFLPTEIGASAPVAELKSEAKTEVKAEKEAQARQPELVGTSRKPENSTWGSYLR